MECWSIIKVNSAAEAVTLKSNLLKDPSSGTSGSGGEEEVIIFTQAGVGLYDKENPQADWQKGMLQLTPWRIIFSVEDAEDKSLSKFGVLFLPLNFISHVSKWRGLGNFSHPKLIIQVKELGSGGGVGGDSGSSGSPSSSTSTGSGGLTSWIPTPKKVTTGSPSGPYCKISFRSGGIDGFFAALNDALAKKRWLEKKSIKPALLQPAAQQNLLNAAAGGSSSAGANHIDPNSPTTTVAGSSNAVSEPASRQFSTSQAGVTGLMRKLEGDAAHKQAALSDAMRDINGVMDNATTIVREVQSMQRVLNSGGGAGSSSSGAADAEQLMLVQQTLGLPCPVSQSTVGTKAAFEREVAKELRGWLNNTSNPLHRVHVVSLIELFSRYNRARGGLDLLSPNDVKKACEYLHEHYSNEFKIVTYKKSGLVVLQRVQSLESTIQLLEKFLGPQPKTLSALMAAISNSGGSNTSASSTTSGVLKGVTEAQLSTHLGISLNIGRTLLEDLELEEVLCRSESALGGVAFHWNFFAVAY